MNLYSIYISEYSEQQDQSDLVIIKQGFSFWAAIFSFFWVIYHRIWKGVFFLVFMALTLTLIGDHTIRFVIDMALLFTFGFLAEDILEKHYKSKGYKISDIILANDEEEAEMLYHFRSQGKSSNEVIKDV